MSNHESIEGVPQLGPTERDIRVQEPFWLEIVAVVAAFVALLAAAFTLVKSMPDAASTQLGTSIPSSLPTVQSGAQDDPRVLVMLEPKGSSGTVDTSVVTPGPMDPSPYPSDAAIESLLQHPVPYDIVSNGFQVPQVLSVTAANATAHGQCKIDTFGILTEIALYKDSILAWYSGPSDPNLVAQGYCPSSVDVFLPNRFMPKL